MVVGEDRREGGVRCVIGRRGECRLFLFQTGAGMKKAEDVCKNVFARQRFDLVVASGFACALTSAEIGDLLIGTEVRLHGGCAAKPSSGPWLSCSGDMGAVAARAAQGIGLAVHSGRFVTVPRVLCRAVEKREVAASTGAIGLDMESAAVCAAAIEQQVPVLVARTASDLLDEDLPVDFNRFLGRSGWTRGVLTCVAHPTCLVGLNRLRIQAAIGAKQLTGFFRRFLDELQ